MCRTCASSNPLQSLLRAAAACGALALLSALAACGSAPSLPEEKSESVAAPPEPAAPAALETTPIADSDAPASTPAEGTKQEVPPAAAKQSKPVAAAAKNAPAAASPAEAPIPAEATRQFESAVALMNSNDMAGAEQAFRAISTAYPTYSGALLNLGILQAKAGKLDVAEQSLQGAIERNASAAAFNQLGIVYRRLGRFKDADAAYQQALQIDPAYANAHLNLGVLCDLYLRQPERALESYERYLQLATTPNDEGAAKVTTKVTGWVTELKARLGAQPRSARTAS